MEGLKKILKMMFYRKGRLFMPYVYAFGTIIIIWTYMIVRLISPLGDVDKEKISDHIIEIVLAEVIIMIRVATWGKKGFSYYDGKEKRGTDENT